MYKNFPKKVCRSTSEFEDFFRIFVKRARKLNAPNPLEVTFPYKVKRDGEPPSKPEKTTEKPVQKKVISGA